MSLSCCLTFNQLFSCKLTTLKSLLFSHPAAFWRSVTTIAIDITPVPDAPVPVNLQLTALENESANITIEVRLPPCLLDSSCLRLCERWSTAGLLIRH